MKNRYFYLFLSISILIHLFMVVFSAIYQPPPDPQKLLVEFSSNLEKTTNKSLTSKNRQKIKKSTKKKSKTTKNSSSKPTLKKNPKTSLVKNKRSFESKLTRKNNHSESHLTKPLTLNKSDYEVKNYTPDFDKLAKKKSSDDLNENSDFLEDIENFDRHEEPESDTLSLSSFDTLQTSQDKNSSENSDSLEPQGSREKQNYQEQFFWKGKSGRRLISRNPFVFPTDLKNRGIHAKVILYFRIDPSGRPLGIKLLKSSGYTQLDNEVKRYTRSFRFNRIGEKTDYEAELVQIFQP